MPVHTRDYRGGVDEVVVGRGRRRSQPRAAQEPMTMAPAPVTQLVVGWERL